MTTPPKPLPRMRARRARGSILLWAGLLWAGAALADEPRQDAPRNEVQVAAGVFFLADRGADLQVNYRKAGSNLQFGLRYVAWADVFVDPYAGHPVDETRYTMVGPLVNYLFTPEEDHSWYVGAELLHTTQTITPMLVGAPTASSSVSSLDPYFGGGYLKRMGAHFYYNLGFYLSPTYHQQNQSAVSSSSQSGNADVELQLGLTF